VKIYDIHSHMGRTSSGEDTSPERMLQELAGIGVSKVGVSSLTGIDSREQNDLVHAAVLAHPDEVVGYAFINPKDPDAPAETERCLTQLGMRGVKFHSWKNGYYPDNRPELWEIFEIIQSHGIHVQMHVGTAPVSTPYTWGIWARRFPGIDFVFTHTGYYEFGRSTIEVARELDNVWVETSGQFDVPTLRESLKVLGANRICFGTDWPYKPLAAELRKFDELSLTDDQAVHIFHTNAEYLWRLS